MIELKVEDYCQDCDAFDPVSTSPFETTTLNETFVKKYTYVTCSQAKRCAAMWRHLERIFPKIRIKEDSNAEA